jgi:nitric oxide reductase NorQ protein
MSSTTDTATDPTDEQILSHFVNRRIREAGGAVKVEYVSMQVSSVADITAGEARSLIDDGVMRGTYQTSRDDNGQETLTAVDPIGPEPQCVTERFGPGGGQGATFVTLDGVDGDIDAVLSPQYDDFEALAEADPETVAQQVSGGLDARAETADFSEETLLTPPERDALHSHGVTTNRDLAALDADDTDVTEASTLTAAKLERAQAAVADDVREVTAADMEPVVADARTHIPAGKHLARDALQRHRDRVAAVGSAAAKVTEVADETDTVGEPLADVRPDLEPDDDEAVYMSDIGANAGDPVHTGLPVLQDVGYEKVPQLATDADAGHAALPVDDDGEVVPPTVPVERDLKQPIDELVAKKLARNVPVRLVGPRGSGKNYLLKYLAYKTNRGYRSLDVDKATAPQDLFGPIAPDEDGKLTPKNGEVKQGLLNGDLVVLNEFPVMQAGAAMSLHQLLNENKLTIKSHGQMIEPHPQARLVITMNPPTREYRDSEPMNSATRGRFRTFWQSYPDDQADEVRALAQQVNSPRPVVDETTLEKIVEFAHRTRRDNMSSWPTLSTRNLTIICEHIADGASAPAAVKNVLRNVAEPNQHVDDAFEAIGEVF